MGPRRALALLLALFVLHAGVSAGWVSRLPAQEKTFHDHDLALVRTPMVLRGEGWAPELPVAELVPPTWPGLGPYDLFGAALRNGDAGQQSYRNLQPLHYLVSAVPAVLGGLSRFTVRLGPLAVLALLLGAAFDMGRALGRGTPSDPGGWKTGLAAAALASAVPVGWLGVVVGVPTLGNLTGVCLALWALVRSDGLRHLGFAALAGALVALSSRWGESVGDALACLAALSGPAAVTLALALGRVFTRREVRGLAGAAVAAGMVWWLLDLAWIQNHFQLYILDEAKLSAGPSSADLQARIGDNVVAYGRAAVFSLLGPAGAAAAVGALGLLWRAWRQPLALLLLAAPVSGLMALSLSAKGHDYYAAPVVPALMVGAAVGWMALPRIGTVLAAAAVAAVGGSWLVTAHLDTSLLEDRACEPVVRRWIAGDPTRCDPRGGQEEQVYPWFREWRRKPAREVRGRRAIGDWLVRGEGRPWLDGLSPGAVVLLQVPPGPGGGADVVQLLGQAERPDTLFHRVEGGMADARSVALLRWAETEGREVQVVTFAPQMHTRTGQPQLPTGWFGPATAGPEMTHVRTWTVRAAGGSGGGGG